MTKIMTLDTISYKTRRAKFNRDVWLTISPFIDLNNLQFGHKYDVTIVMDKSNQWYIEDMKVKENVGK